MESYNEFLDRIHSFQNPVLNLGDGDFEVNPSLKNKVDTNINIIANINLSLKIFLRFGN